jgi:hypothetical protein
VGLSEKWQVTPVGGAGRIPTFVTLFGTNGNSPKMATLIDIPRSETPRLENLYKWKILEKRNVLTFGRFVGADEATIEDMFGDEFYIRLVNQEFLADLAAPLAAHDLPQNGSRVLPRLEKLLEGRPLGTARFDRYRPARYFAENITSLEGAIPPRALDRFEEAFKALEGLIGK